MAEQTDAPGPAAGHRSPRRSARCAAARLSDVAHGGACARHRAHRVADRQPEPPARPASAPATSPAPNADRVRDYQDRLRRWRNAARRGPGGPADATTAARRPHGAAGERARRRRSPPTERRREYESLFASNVVLSRRPEAQRPMRGAAPRATAAVDLTQSTPVDRRDRGCGRARDDAHGHDDDVGCRRWRRARNPEPPTPGRSRSC